LNQTWQWKIPLENPFTVNEGFFHGKVIDFHGISGSPTTPGRLRGIFSPRDSQFIETKRPLATRQSLRYPTSHHHVYHRDNLHNHPINVGNYTLYCIYIPLWGVNLQNYNRPFNIAMETLHLQMIDHKFPYQTWITMCPRLSETTMSYSSSP
jgi:hypothetical protein